MPQYAPTQRDVHVNTPLTNISVAFMQSSEGFVASQVFPTVPVQKQSDRYWTYNRGDFNRDEMEKRADGTESAGSGYRVDSTPTYFADVWSLHKDIGDQTRANYDSVLNADRDATNWLSTKGLIKQEVEFASNYLQTGIWDQDFAGVSGAPGGGQFQQWNEADSTPIEDIRAEMTAQQLRSTFRPNTLLFTQQVLDALVDHPDIVDRVKYGTQSQVSTVDISELRALWKIERILVMSGIVNAAQRGLTTEEQNQFIAGRVAWLGYAAPAPGLMVPTAGYTFRWRGLMGSVGDSGTTISKFRMRELKADRVEIEMAFDQKVVATEMGTLFNNAVASS